MDILALVPHLIAFASAWWLGLYLIQRDPKQRSMLLTGVGLVIYALALAANAVAPDLTAIQILLFVPALFWAGTLWNLRNEPLETAKHRWGRRALIVLFISLSGGLILLPFNPIPTLWILLIGLDLFILGVVIAALDALDAGEALIPDMIRSILSAELMGWLFGGLVVLTMNAIGVSPELLTLTFAGIGLAIALSVFSGALQTAVDRVALAYPAQRQERAELRAAAAAIPRQQPAFDLAALDDAEFARLTRRALSSLNDLPRLAASPLIGLSQIDTRLTVRGASSETLERTNELKRLLIDCIARLKPERGDFGTTGEWRHYNALYFPYVVGLRPYSQNAHDDLDSTAREALEWLRAQVPERTLHNWQTAAARLVAQHLRENEPMTEQLAVVGSEIRSDGSPILS